MWGKWRMEAGGERRTEEWIERTVPERVVGAQLLLAGVGRARAAGRERQLLLEARAQALRELPVASTGRSRA